MRCEVVAIGSELLLGQIVDTNSAWIGERLALAGIDCHFQIRVGDNARRMAAAIRQALARSDAVICCGGLGPTPDDITREALAGIMGVGLRRDEAVAARIRAMFEARGRRMPDNNLRQAEIPEGARTIAEMPGTAPGMICPVGGKAIYALPGVPDEMKEMMLGSVLPDLRRRAGTAATIRSRVLKTWGMSESGLAEALDGRLRALDASGNPTLAFQASGIEGIKVRITARGGDAAAAGALLDAEQARIAPILGRHLFAVDDATMESAVLELLARRGLTLAAHESLTGGLLAARMADADPQGARFVGAIVRGGGGHGDARAAAEEARRHFGADAAIAAHRAGDGRAGAVQLGLAGAAGEASIAAALPGDLARLRRYAVIALLDALRLALEGGGGG